MSTSSRSNVPSSNPSQSIMDPFCHPFALAAIREPHSKWRGGALLKDVLKSVRQQLHRSGADDVRQHLRAKTKPIWKETPKETQRIKIPSIVKISPNFTDNSSGRRSSFHHSRSLSNTRHNSTHRRKLSSIPEADDHDEAVSEDSNSAPSITSITNQQPLEASFLGLPTELRLQIYELVFGDWENTNALPLLSACRKIHSEAAGIAFSRTLFRVHSEHWPDQDYFQARHTSLLSPTRLSSIRNLAVRLPRGAPYDCYNSRHLHVNLGSLGLQLKNLVIFSHYPRPLPRSSDYGGVLEMSLCLWLRDALYSMRTLESIRIVNYESATPGLFDIPSPRLVRLLRGEIFKDVMTERQSLSEEEFTWECLDSEANVQNRAYRVSSTKLGRTVNIVFEDGEHLPSYGLGHITEIKHMLNPDDLIKNNTHPDMSTASYANLLAHKHSQSQSTTANTSRRRLGKSPSRRQLKKQVELQERQYDLSAGCPGRVGGSHFSPPGSPEPGKSRRRLTKRLSLSISDSTPVQTSVVAVNLNVNVNGGLNEGEHGKAKGNKSNTQQRRSWHPLSRTMTEKRQSVISAAM